MARNTATYESKQRTVPEVSLTTSAVFLFVVRSRTAKDNHQLLSPVVAGSPFRCFNSTAKKTESNLLRPRLWEPYIDRLRMPHYTKQRAGTLCA